MNIDCTKHHCHCHHDPSKTEMFCTSDMTSCKHCNPMTVEEWKVKFSRELQSLEGMEIISPLLRSKIEFLCVQFIDAVSDEKGVS